MGAGGVESLLAVFDGGDGIFAVEEALDVFAHVAVIVGEEDMGAVGGVGGLLVEERGEVFVGEVFDDLLLAGGSAGEPAESFLDEGGCAEGVVGAAFAGSDAFGRKMGCAEGDADGEGGSFAELAMGGDGAAVEADKLVD
jgi:hypothetical protein